jgi:tRNA dimethylallyltransferase
MEEKETVERVLVIGGPTGLGKSVVAYSVAKEINGEIISADSRQFYREINVGTDKVPLWMRKEIPHHLIDFLSLKDDFDVYRFAGMAYKRICEIRERGRIPITVGGSGLYLRSLMKGIFTIPDADRERQDEIRQKLEKKTTEELYEELQRTDPLLKTAIHPNDRRRIRRALEVYYITGKQMSYWQRQKPETALGKSERLYFILSRERKEMYERIEHRVDKMFEDGWIDEVERLKKKGYDIYLHQKAPIGYVEILEYLNGKYSIEKLKSDIKQKTRRFAKKQLTWFRKEDGIWLELSGDGKSTADEIVKRFNQG